MNETQRTQLLLIISLETLLSNSQNIINSQRIEQYN